MKQQSAGFTLIELLLTVSIIGLLSSIVVVSVGVMRSKSRDARRISDIKQIQTSLEAYWNLRNSYPVSPGNNPLGSANARILCILDNGQAGFQVANTNNCATTFLNPVAANVTPNGANYIYTSTLNNAACNAEPCNQYSVAFRLESGAGTFPSGAYALTQTGITRTGD